MCFGVLVRVSICVGYIFHNVIYPLVNFGSVPKRGQQGETLEVYPRGDRTKLRSFNNYNRRDHLH